MNVRVGAWIIAPYDKTFRVVSARNESRKARGAAISRIFQGNS